MDFEPWREPEWQYVVPVLVVGNTVAELENSALSLARELAGDQAVLRVRRGYTVNQAKQGLVAMSQETRSELRKKFGPGKLDAHMTVEVYARPVLPNEHTPVRVDEWVHWFKVGDLTVFGDNATELIAEAYRVARERCGPGPAIRLMGGWTMRDASLGGSPRQEPDQLRKFYASIDARATLPD
jgi:hypothetical protein